MAAKYSRSLMASRTVASSGRRWATFSIRSFAFMGEGYAKSLPEGRGDDAEEILTQGELTRRREGGETRGRKLGDLAAARPSPKRPLTPAPLPEERRISKIGLPRNCAGRGAQRDRRDACPTRS